MQRLETCLGWASMMMSAFLALDSARFHCLA